MIVADVLGHQPFEMPLVEHDHMIEQVSPAIADEAFCDSVLPGTAKASSLGFYPEALDGADDLFAEVRCPVEDQIARRRAIRKSLAKLLADPCATRMYGDAAMEDVPPVVGDHKEAIKDIKGQRWHGEEVHRRNRFSMIAEKRCPSFCRLRTSGRLPHPALHRSLRDVVAEHLQFAMDARRSPSSVLGHHAEDQLAQFPAHTSSARTLPMPREPRPIQLEPCPVPPDNRLRLDEDQCPLPLRPEPTQENPKESVRSLELGYGCLAFRTASCCRRARFSRSKLWREHTPRARSPKKSLSVRDMSLL